MADNHLKIDLHSRLAVNPNLVLRIESNECALLFDPDNGRVELLNSTAVAIWQQLDGERSLHEVIANLGELYEGVDEVAAGQILVLVNKLAALGVVGVWEQA